MDARNLRLTCKPLRQLQRIAAVALHAQCQGLYAAQGEESVERPGDSTHRVLQKAQALGQLEVLPDHRDAADHVGVAVQILGRRVQHDIEAQFQRTLNPRAGKGVVSHTDDASLATGARDGGEVSEA
ncbi:hypothetical protein D3C79_850110 [compost metagenome]